MIRVPATGVGALHGLAAMLVAASAFAQTGGAGAAEASRLPPPIARVSFEEAIQRAVERNPSSAIAAASILRAQGLLAEAQANTRLQVNGNVTTTTLNEGVEFDGTVVSPRNQLTGALDVRMPLYAPARWARRAQAQDAMHLAELSAADVRRQTALAAADAYLTVIARRRAIGVTEQARDTARAHLDLATELEQRGTGSRLNQLRARQEVSIDETLVEAARLALYRAQEALGVLLVVDGPVDANGEPLFTLPADAGRGAGSAAGSIREASGAGMGAAEARQHVAGAQASPLFGRTDIRLFTAQVQAAERAYRDARKDAYPYLEGVFLPQSTYPGQFFTPNNSWRALLQVSVPIFDSGRRSGVRREQEAALNISIATLASAMTRAGSEVRAARAAVDSAERSLASARASGDEARQVVDIVNTSFRAGASTNIEVIDAERRWRDADALAAIAEDTLRRARLDLLTALGLFPQ